MQPRLRPVQSFPQGRRPLAPVTMILFALNLSVFAVMLAGGGRTSIWSSKYLLDWGANYAPLTMDGQWWRLLTCMFVHGGILHMVVRRMAAG